MGAGWRRFVIVKYLIGKDLHGQENIQQAGGLGSHGRLDAAGRKRRYSSTVPRDRGPYPPQRWNGPHKRIVGF